MSFPAPGHRHLSLLLSGLLWALGAHATTLTKLDIDTLASDSELIFEGEVVAQEVRRDLGSGLIYTYLSFVVRDVLKGSLPGTILELRFTGGSHEGQTVEVSGSDIPEIGETGIYFVESTTRPLINPLLGWSQGQFLIVEENGERRVYSAANEPVLDIQPMADVPASLRRPQPLVEGSGAHAAGVVTAPGPADTARPLSVEAFKARMQQLLERVNSE